MYNNRHGHGQAGGSRATGGGNPFMDALEKLKDDYNHMQAQLSTQRAELDKMNAEKEQLQRHYMMYYEMSCGLNMEMQKQSEVAKRMTQLLQSTLAFVPPEQQANTMAAMERAKQISLPELQQLSAANQAQQMLGMAAGPMGAMGGALGMAGLGGPGGLNMAAIAAAMGGMRPPHPAGDDRPAQSASRQSTSRHRSQSPSGAAGEKKPKIEAEDGDDDEIDVQNDDPAGPATNGKTGRDSAHSGISSSGASTPAAKNFAALGGGHPRLPLAQLDPTARMMMGMGMQNGKPLYSYRLDAAGNLAPTMFPPDALTDPAVPKSVSVVHDLPHGEVVCAVSISKDAQRVYTGGKGCVKIWDLAGTAPQVARARLECLDDNYIRSCKLYAEGTHLVVGGEASNILVFDIESQKEVAKLDTTAQACYALALNQESRLLYACCADGAVVIFDLTSMQEVARLPGHSDGASCVDLSGDGLRLWTGGLDHTLRSWDIRERKELSNVDFASQIFSLGCSPTEDWVAVGLDTNQIEVVNTLPGVKERYQLHRHDSCVLSLRFAHSGKWFCTTGKDNLLNLWRSPYGALAVRASESSSVLSCDISQDDSVIVTGSGEKKATVYQVQYEPTA